MSLFVMRVKMLVEQVSTNCRTNSRIRLHQFHRNVFFKIILDSLQEFNFVIVSTIDLCCRPLDRRFYNELLPWQ